jgi:hypothetical protein
MPLSTAKSGLETAIKTAFESVKSGGEQDGASPASIIAQLAADLAVAIHDYTTQAEVNVTTVNTNVSTAGSPSAQTGTGTGTGSGELL